MKIEGVQISVSEEGVPTFLLPNHMDGLAFLEWQDRNRATLKALGIQIGKPPTIRIRGISVPKGLGQ